MIPIGTPQRGLPWIPAILNIHYLTIIDIKDYFFSIALHSDDVEEFEFSIPSTNFCEPDLRFKWTVVPKGMANRPPMCQYYMLHIFSSLIGHPNIFFYIYMDDIIWVILTHLASKILLPNVFLYLRPMILRWLLKSFRLVLLLRFWVPCYFLMLSLLLNPNFIFRILIPCPSSKRHCRKLIGWGPRFL